MRHLIILVCILFTAINVYAEKLTLKSGKTVEGVIVEKTDAYIKMKIEDISIPLTYYMDDIKSIDSSSPETVTVPKEDAGIIRDNLLPFQLGVCKVGDNEIKFNFPMEQGSLYAFSMAEWKSNRVAPEVKLVIALYDKDKKLIEKSASVCHTEKMKSFGSIAFDTDKPAINTVAYFSAEVEACVKDIKHDESQPQVKFAQKVLAAIKESKEAFVALYSSKPSEQMAAMEDFIYQSAKGMLESGGKLGEIKPVEGKELTQYKDLCEKPYRVEIKSQTTGNTSSSISFPIGEVNGEWKVLNVEK